MSTPIPIKGKLDCYGNPLIIYGPNPFVQELEPHLSPGSLIADIGSFSGDNGLYLGQRGHKVASVDINYEALIDGVNKSQVLGSVATRSFFIQGDARQLMFPDNQFDAVIALHLLQLIPKTDIHQAINEIQRTTS